MFGYINDETPEEKINGCKTLTQKIKVYCYESLETKPASFLERHDRLNGLLLNMGDRWYKHSEEIIISAETVLKLQEVKKNIENDFKKLYPDCDIFVRDI